jgi:hypothetical protein
MLFRAAAAAADANTQHDYCNHREQCEVLVEVQGAPISASTVDSLNVSVTGALLLYALRQGSGVAGASTETEDMEQGFDDE